MSICVVGINRKSARYYEKKIEFLSKLVRINKALNNFIFIIKFTKKRSCYYASIEAQTYKSTRKDLGPLISMVVFYKSVPKHLMTKTLLHELIHVRQYIKRRLLYVRNVSRGPVVVYWKKNNIGKLSSIPYERQPWEQEAEEKADDYYDKYLELIAAFRNR